MCNLYSMRGKPKDWAAHYSVDEYDPQLDLIEYTSFYPDSVGPVVRLDPLGSREVVGMRWGFPKPANIPGPPLPVTNVRNTKSSYWRAWPGNRCLVPFTSFSEYAPEPDPITKKKGRGVVREERQSAAHGVRRHLEAMDGHARHEEEPDRGRAPALFIPDDRRQ